MRDLLKKTHTVQDWEVVQVQKLGFTISTDQTLSADFINKHFPNFNVLEFATKVDDILSPLAVAKIIKTITLKEAHPPSINLVYYSEDWDQKEGLAVSRTFLWEAGNLIVCHDYFQLPLSKRGKGIAKEFFKASIQEYVNMEVRKIKVHASLEDGGYVWAKNFFVAIDRSEVKTILSQAGSKLKTHEFGIVKRIYDNYYSKNPTGEAFPIVRWAQLPFMVDILRGSDWHGIMDLKNNEQFSNFKQYVYGTP